MHDFEFGLDTPAQVTVDESGQELEGDQVIRNTIEEAVLADSVGIDSFDIGEHYRPEFMDPAGHVILAAIAGRTERIRPEPVKPDETTCHADLMSASGVGSLIQATVGSFGGRGRRCPNRAGLAA